MNLAEIGKGKMVQIVSIEAPIGLKKRLGSLGISAGKKIEILEMTLQKNTIKLGIGLGSVALRLDEAQCIEVAVIV